MHTCSLCRAEIPEAPAERWTTDDGESLVIDKTASPCAVIDTSVGEITVCDSCYALPLPDWLTAEDVREVHYQFGLEHSQRGEPRLAIACFERALTSDLSADVLAALGNAQNELGDSQNAASSYRRALELDPGHWARDNLNRLTNR